MLTETAIPRPLTWFPAVRDIHNGPVVVTWLRRCQLEWDATGCQKLCGLLLVAGGIRCSSVNGPQMECQRTKWHCVWYWWCIIGKTSFWWYVSTLRILTRYDFLCLSALKISTDAISNVRVNTIGCIYYDPWLIYCRRMWMCIQHYQALLSYRLEKAQW